MNVFQKIKSFSVTSPNYSLGIRHRRDPLLLLANYICAGGSHYYYYNFFFLIHPSWELNPGPKNCGKQRLPQQYQAKNDRKNQHRKSMVSKLQFLVSLFKLANINCFLEGLRRC